MNATPTIALQRVATGVRVVLETRSLDGTYADRIVGRIAAQIVGRMVALRPDGWPSTLCEANDGPLCIALARECVHRGSAFTAYLPRHAAIEVRKALQGYRAKVVLADSPEAAELLCQQHGQRASLLFANAFTEAANELAAQLAQTVADDGGRIDGLVAPRLLLEAFGAAHRGPAVALREPHATAEVKRATRARLGAEEGLLVSLDSAGAVATAAQLARELGAGAVVYTVALDTGERDFSLARKEAS